MHTHTHVLLKWSVRSTSIWQTNIELCGRMCDTAVWSDYKDPPATLGIPSVLFWSRDDAMRAWIRRICLSIYTDYERWFPSYTFRIVAWIFYQFIQFVSWLNNYVRVAPVQFNVIRPCLHCDINSDRNDRKINDLLKDLPHKLNILASFPIYIPHIISKARQLPLFISVLYNSIRFSAPVCFTNNELVT